VAFLGKVTPGWIGPKLAKWGGASELFRKSCWGWGLCCFLDIIATRRKQAELARVKRNVTTWPRTPAKDGALALIARTERALSINVARMALFFIPNIQWSLQAGSR
jgi:hypothetical protein